MSTPKQPDGIDRGHMRDLVFVSHANPEDNDFARWVTLQLAREGYRVWSDLTKLLGGEDFWMDIEAAIRRDTSKLLFVLSRSSNTKVGPLKELQLAENVARQEKLHDFIIPLHIDDLPHQATNIQLARLNAIAFERGWIHGLRPLLAKLEQDGVPKNPKFNAAAVSSWWRREFAADGGVSDESEEYLSNWFPVRGLPPDLQFYELSRKTTGLLELPGDLALPYPAFQHGQYLVSFAAADDFASALNSDVRLGESYPLPAFDASRLRAVTKVVDRKQMRDFVTSLLRMAWDGMVMERRLPVYDMANKVRCLYFTSGLVAADTVSFRGVRGKPASRSVVGFKTVKARREDEGIKRIWHFGIHTEPLLHPEPAFAVRPHVLFSDDGKTVWESKARLHKARRGQCKNWWNPEWRDRILATMTWLAGETGEIELRLGSSVSAYVSSSPLLFVSPVSYAEPERSTPEEAEELVEKEQADDDFDELDDEGED